MLVKLISDSRDTFCMQLEIQLITHHIEQLDSLALIRMMETKILLVCLKQKQTIYILLHTNVCAFWYVLFNDIPSLCGYSLWLYFAIQDLISTINQNHSIKSSHHINKANLRNLIAATGLAILLKFYPNHRFFSPCDLEIWWMTFKNNRAPLLYYIKLCPSFQSLAEFKLKLQSGNAQFGSNRQFFVPCDVEIWQMT